jgi:hypothetical protein
MPGLVTERCVQPKLNHVLDITHRHEPGRDANHVGVVMLAGKTDDFVWTATNAAVFVNNPANNRGAVINSAPNTFETVCPWDSRKKCKSFSCSNPAWSLAMAIFIYF